MDPYAVRHRPKQYQRYIFEIQVFKIHGLNKKNHGNSGVSNVICEAMIIQVVSVVKDSCAMVVYTHCDIASTEAAAQYRGCRQCRPGGCDSKWCRRWMADVIVAEMQPYKTRVITCRRIYGLGNIGCELTLLLLSLWQY